MGVLFVFSFAAAILFLGMHRGHCASIIGGRWSNPHSRPYMAAIMRGDGLICGGTLIRENWVLTAAHCEIQIGDTVILGARSLTRYENEKQFFQVTRVIRPTDYNPETFEHDIMLLQLDGRAWINNSVKTIQLPTTNEDVRAGTQCLVAGWGRTTTTVWSDVLQEIDVTIVDRHSCKEDFGPGLITYNKLCAGLINQRGGHCHGDSGGPLICQGIQRGIVSFHPKNNCGSSKSPDGYTRLTMNHILWINKNVPLDSNFVMSQASKYFLVMKDWAMALF